MRRRVASDFYVTPVKRARLVHSIVDKIEGLILDKHLVPGDKLPSERDLSTQLGVGRYALREAIRILEARGIVEVRPGTGTYVTNLESDLLKSALGSLLLGKRDEILHLLQVRQFLEVKAAGLLAQKGLCEEDLLQLEELVLKMESMAVGASAYASVDTQFHSMIIHLVGNPILSQIVDSVRDLVLSDIRKLIRLPDMQERSAWHHRQVLRCITRGDCAGAEAAMQDHLDDVEEAARSLY